MSKKKNNKGLEDFKQSKVFVMTRPQEHNPALQLTTENLNQQNEQLTELYNTALFDVLFNIDRRLKPLAYQNMLRIIVPTLALRFVETDTDVARSVIEQFLQTLKEVDSESAEFARQLPDTATQLDYLLRHHFQMLQMMMDTEGVEAVLQDNEDFVHDMGGLLTSLPVAYCFSLIDFFADHVTPLNKAKKSKKKPKVKRK